MPAPTTKSEELSGSFFDWWSLHRPHNGTEQSLRLVADQTSSAPRHEDDDPSSVWEAVRKRVSGLRPSRLSERIDSIDEGYVEDEARKITETDLDTVVQRATAIEERFRGDGPLGRLMEDGRLLLSLVQDARHGRYRAVPVWTLSAAAFALLYVLNPFDLVPDVLPVVGLLDDAAVVSACLSLVEQDLRDYRTWRRTHEDGDSEDENLISS